MNKKKEYHRSHNSFTSDSSNGIANRVINIPPVLLQQPMKEISPELEPLLKKVAIDRDVVISVFDFSFLSQFYSFYHNSILPLGITNFIAFALDKRTYMVRSGTAF